MPTYNCILFFKDTHSIVIEGMVKYYINKDNIFMVIYKYDSKNEGLSVIETRTIELPDEDHFEKIFSKNIKNIHKTFFKDSYYKED